jgi:hypothetical protein
MFKKTLPVALVCVVLAGSAMVTGDNNTQPSALDS